MEVTHNSHLPQAETTSRTEQTLPAGRTLRLSSDCFRSAIQSCRKRRGLILGAVLGVSLCVSFSLA